MPPQSRPDLPPGRDWSRVADVLPHAVRWADWQRVTALYEQYVRILADGSEQEPPEELLDALAKAIDGLSPTYRLHEEEMCQHGLAIFADVEGQETLDPEVFRYHYRDSRFTRTDGTGPAGRRRPTPFEALVETCRRLRDAHAVREVLKSTGTSGLLCGSTAYGQFYNVRGRRGEEPPSDLDYIIVLGDTRTLDTILPELSKLPGIAHADLDRLTHRARLFAEQFDDRKTTLSHKLTLWAGGIQDPIIAPEAGRHDYLLSLHLVTVPVLEYLLVDSVSRIVREAAGGSRTIRIYREATIDRHDRQRTFSGYSHVMDLDTKQAEGGWLLTTRAYHIDKSDAYCPGFFQSMLVPKPELLWDELEIGPRLDQFRRKIDDRIRYESSRDPNRLLRPSFAHPRRAVFAPGVIQQLDGPYSGS
jgi:hypothetical protein